MNPSNTFVYTANPARIVFGSGTIRTVPDELARHGLSKPLILCTPEQMDAAEMISEVLGGKTAGTFGEATMHTPTHVTQRGLEFAQESGAGSLISIGGGSTTGLGKAISIRSGLFHLSIPTTYAGSEVTPVLGETENGIKTTRSDMKILPGAVIYDVDLTKSLPIGLSLLSGVNAIAHAVEALYASDKNPIISLLAVEGIKALVKALPELARGESIGDEALHKAREEALYGAWLCGTCLGHVRVALHHKLCHTLGGSFNLPHAPTHTVVLPHALAYNAPSVPEALEKLSDAFPGCDGDTVAWLDGFLDKLGVERSLKALGLKEEDIDRAADIAVKSPYANPRPVERDLIREVIRRTWAGEKARADI